MGENKPIWEQIGSSFVQHYYQLFDTDRTQLGAIYVSSDVPYLPVIPFLNQSFTRLAEQDSCLTVELTILLILKSDEMGLFILYN